MKQLKYPVFDLVRMEETRAVKAALQAESLLGIDIDNLSGADAEVFGHIAEARRFMGEAMAPQVAGYAKVLLVGGLDKLVIFYWHVSVGDVLDQALKPYGVVRVDGTTSALAKEAIIRSFTSKPSCRVIIGNLLSLGTGTDGLQEVCSYAILAEPDWTLGTNVQCFDRLDRGGQRNQVQGDIMVASGSLSERVLAAALRKGKNTQAALDRRYGSGSEN
jgi:SNF2 family DNA or RNA helicase